MDVPSDDMRDIVLQVSMFRMRPGDAAKQAKEMNDEDAKDKTPSSEEENDDLVNLVEQSRGDSKPPKVTQDDLPADIAKAMKRKKTKK